MTQLTINLCTHFDKNTGEYMIRDCTVQSINNQTDKDFKLNIIINNYSSKLELPDFDKLFPDIDKNVLPINGVTTLSTARNKGINNTSTNYFTQVDYDDELSSNYVKLINNAIEDTSDNPKIIKFGCVEVDPAINETRYFPYRELIYLQHRYDYMFNCSYVFYKPHLDEVGFQYPTDVRLKIEDQLAYIKLFCNNKFRKLISDEINYLPEYIYKINIEGPTSFRHVDANIYDPSIFKYLKSICPVINVNNLN